MPSRTFWRVGFGVHLLVVVAIGGAAYLRLLPSVNQLLPKLDFLLHALLIGGVAFFLDGALGFRPLLPERLAGARWSWLRLAPVLVLALAGIEELAQSLSPYRSCSFSDFVGDLIGVCFFSWLAWRVELWRRKRQETSQ